jgi:uncharacterized protein
VAKTYDVVVVGAGPAGLSAVNELAGNGTCLVVEQGAIAPLRKRDRARDLLEGAGGAGLFSDGKHSFFPSASALWKLPDREALSRAYEGAAALLGRYGVQAGPLPDSAASSATRLADGGGWQEKHYPALYVGFDARLACITELWDEPRVDRVDGRRVVDAERAGDEIVLTLEAGVSRTEEMRTRKLLVAGGRLSPRWTREWLQKLGVSFAFQRVELGVRLEMESSHPLFASLPGVDGKLRFVEAGGVEIRTFCTCRDGEVVLGTSGGIAAYSGRADGPRTGRSNVGLVVRMTDEQVARDVEKRLYSSTPAVFPLGEWIAGREKKLAPWFGDAGAGALTRALDRLRERTPGIDGATVYAPCIEGVGDYPRDDGNLAVAPGVWIAGDAVGRFRGIVASMVSGRYAAGRMLRQKR